MDIYLFQIIFVAVLALVSTIGLSVRGYLNKDWTRLPEIFPRAYTFIIYTIIAFTPSAHGEGEIYGLLVRFGITGWLVTENLYNITLLLCYYKKLRGLPAHDPTR